MEEQLVIFQLNEEAYGISVAQVQSIIPMQHIITVPGAPSFIEGVINLRGAVVPVVDLRTRFELISAHEMAPIPQNQGEKKGKGKSVIIITELNKLQVGLIVDKVTEVTKIAAASIEPPSALLTSIDTAYLRGIGKFKDTLVILLDLERIFMVDELKCLTLK